MMNKSEDFLNRMQGLLDSAKKQGRVIVRVEDIENTFPELESEEERIHKLVTKIVDWYNVRHQYFTEIPKEKVMAWLEKQGEPQDKGEISDGYHTFNELYYYRMLYNAAFFNMLPKEWVHKSKKHNDGEECFGGGWFIVMANLPTGQISNHYEIKDWDLFQIPEKEIADKWDGHTPQEAANRLHKYLLEEQESCEQKKVSIWKHWGGHGIAGNGEGKTIYLIKIGNTYSLSSCLGVECDYIELSELDKLLSKKQGEQKSDNLEPKFKVGDWIVYNRNDSSREILYVYDIRDGRYYFNDNIHFSWSVKECDEKSHLWATKDAKDGDVLSDGTTIFIFKDLLSDDSVMSYCDCDTDSDESDAFCPLSVNLMCSKITPATKEQRDLLFKKMKESRYVWDTEKKELKKIEDEEYNGEDDGIDSLRHAKNVLEKTLDRSKEQFLSFQIQAYLNTASDELYAKGKPLYSEERLEEIHKCMLMWQTLHNAYFYQKPAWSKEDENIRQWIISDIEKLFVLNKKSSFIVNKEINWLKSIKDRVLLPNSSEGTK